MVLLNSENFNRVIRIFPTGWLEYSQKYTRTTATLVFSPNVHHKNTTFKLYPMALIQIEEVAHHLSSTEMEGSKKQNGVGPWRFPYIHGPI